MQGLTPPENADKPQQPATENARAETQESPAPAVQEYPANVMASVLERHEQLANKIRAKNR